jgi:uncharacterized damage-inducible protein DinB
MPTLVDSIFLESAWSSERLIEVCAPPGDEQLDATIEDVYGSIRGTLLHALSADQYYLTRLGRPPAPELVLGADVPGFEALKRVARDNG